MKVHALILGNIALLSGTDIRVSGCEFKNSKALEMEFALGLNEIYVWFLLHTNKI